MLSLSTPNVGSVTTVRRRRCSPIISVLCGSSRFPSVNNNVKIDEHFYVKRSLQYWDKFYKLHQNKFFKDRHYLVKDWGKYFSCENDDDSPKVVLEVGCGAGNTIYPLLAEFTNLYVLACDFSPKAVSLVKLHSNYDADRVEVFVCDVTSDNLSENISPSSVDVITLIFTLSAISPSKMPSVLQNLKKVLKPNGFILLRDYAFGDYAQVKLQQKNQMISENFCFRGDGTCSFYFSEDFLTKLFSRGGFKVVDVSVHHRQIENHSKNIAMHRCWVRAIFRRL